MRFSRTSSIVLAAGMLASYAAAVLAQSRVEQMRSVTRAEDVLYIPSSKVVKRLSMGYTGLAAAIYWTRAVQYFGSKHLTHATEYPLLAPLLDITTDLDPYLIVAYRFGATFLAQQPPGGAGEPDKAIALVQKGINNNPDDWHLYYDLGFLYAMELRDYRAAADAFERGSRVPNAHPFLKVLAATMAQHGGDLETARSLWTLTYGSTEDKLIRQNATDHLKAIQVDEEVDALNALIKRYGESTGSLPTSFQELVRDGYLPGIPVDPNGKPYRVLADGSVVVQDPENLPFITKGLPPGYQPREKAAAPLK
jgi:hypothetical protein